MFKPLELKKDITWVGALDYDIRVFDIIMWTDYGTTYNSYVVKGTEKNVLFEVVKEAFFDEFKERFTQVMDFADLDYIVLNHTEPDHSGALKKLLPLCPKAKVVGSNTAIKFLKEIVNGPFEYMAVKDGDTLSLGDKTLTFLSVPLLHWPDSMFTYIPENKTLFTCDSFGCHFASEQVFNDAVNDEKFMEGFMDAYKYYFDHIMGPFKTNVLSALDKIDKLDIETICNGHGPVIRTEPWKYINMYREWATVPKKDKKSVVIVYATAYQYTKRMAERIADVLKKDNALDVFLFNVVTDDRAEIMRHVGEADGLLLGSPTLVGDALPPIAGILTELNPIIHKGKLAGAFGSYGWSGEAVPNLEGRLAQLKFKMPVPGLRVNFQPSDEQMEEVEAFAKGFKEALLNV